MFKVFATMPESFWVTASGLDLLGEQEIKEKTDKTKMDMLRTGYLFMVKKMSNIF